MIQYDTIGEFNARQSTCRLRPILQIELDALIFKKRSTSHRSHLSQIGFSSFVSAH